jgi:hypothetical protein
VLTKRLERPKVNCGTVLRTRMNIDDRASFEGMFSHSISSGDGERAQKFILERKKE